VIAVEGAATDSMTEDVLLLGTLVLLLLAVVVERDHVAASITLLPLKDINLGLCHLRIDDTRRRGHTLAHHRLMAQGFAVEVL
jgi:hypothetical protein